MQKQYVTVDSVKYTLIGVYENARILTRNYWDYPGNLFLHTSLYPTPFLREKYPTRIVSVKPKSETNHNAAWNSFRSSIVPKIEHLLSTFSYDTTVQFSTLYQFDGSIALLFLRDGYVCRQVYLLINNSVTDFYHAWFCAAESVIRSIWVTRALRCNQLDVYVDNVQRTVNVRNTNGDFDWGVHRYA